MKTTAIIILAAFLCASCVTSGHHYNGPERTKLFSPTGKYVGYSKDGRLYTPTGKYAGRSVK